MTYVWKKMDYVENIANHSTFNSQRNLGVAFFGGGIGTYMFV